jgi:hypothetical protein
MTMTTAEVTRIKRSPDHAEPTISALPNNGIANYIPHTATVRLPSAGAN